MSYKVSVALDGGAEGVEGKWKVPFYNTSTVFVEKNSSYASEKFQNIHQIVTSHTRSMTALLDMAVANQRKEGFQRTYFKRCIFMQ